MGKSGGSGRLGLLGLLGILGLGTLGTLGSLAPYHVGYGVRVYAQEEIESCFNYYDYGKVQVNLATEKPSYAPGETARVKGTVVNENTFPLVDIVLYAHVKRVNETSFAENGHHLVDRLTLVDNLNFIGGETKWIDADFPIMAEYPNGEYQLQYFIFSKNGFHYAGRPFLEEDAAGYSVFNIAGGNNPIVYFDLENIIVGGEKHTVREGIAEFPARPLLFEIGVADKRVGKEGVSAKVSFYSFEATFQEKVVMEREAGVGSGKVEAVFLPPGPGAYELLAEIEGPVKTMLKYRFAVEGEEVRGLRMNDVGVTDFPAGTDGRAWVCFHSPTNKNAPETSVTLSVLDSGKNVVAAKSVRGSFPPEVQAISIPLGSLRDLRDFRVRAEFREGTRQKLAHLGGQGGRVVEVHYDCERFGGSVVDLAVGEGGGLAIGGVNVCGERVEEGGYIESIKVKDRAGEVVKEAYNRTFAEAGDFNLAGLPGGDYSVEVKSGETVKTLGVTVEKKRNYLLIILGTLGTLGTLGIGYYVWRKMRE